ncbi:MAG: hypothetical protein ACI808_001148 [Paraglaciecola sp.]|jgi:hypothetical protein
MEKKLTISGAKAHQHKNNEDRSLEFRAMHRTLDKKLYATDIDLVEMRMISGTLTAVGTLELTRVDNNIKVNNIYLDSIIERYTKRDFQKNMACYLAKKLGVKAWIVLFNEDLSEFWIYCLSGAQNRWYHFDIFRFEKWLANLEKGVSIHTENPKRNFNVKHLLY